METAKENGINPREYLIYLFEQLPNINKMDQEAVAQLLPWSETVQKLLNIPTTSSR